MHMCFCDSSHRHSYSTKTLSRGLATIVPGYYRKWESDINLEKGNEKSDMNLAQIVIMVNSSAELKNKVFPDLSNDYNSHKSLKWESDINLEKGNEKSDMNLAQIVIMVNSSAELKNKVFPDLSNDYNSHKSLFFKR
ncbi:Hypothetical predicted protein [Octopus vulgaris]|uniref:Uncharacterized protein n=1 Tax=Octopus vulgaris TaxID=6645 RepID=A0AA36F691_OCTVU|nr:Hypothetical predicted protein [Octopus vulgaris]